MARAAGCGSCYVVDTAERAPVESQGDPTLSSHDNQTPHLPPPSIWPFGFAVGIACLLTGLVVSTIVAIVGGAIALVFGILWIRDVTRPVRAPAEPVEPERRVALPAAAAVEEGEAVAGHSRAVFLSMTTLGLGAVIGGLVTVPALGFAVLPSFTNVEEPSPNLGPIDEYPEGQWVIATYLEDEGIGEVTRRTMYIRNNGFTEGVPSFTIIFSRCVHLGCPVQPNGPIDDEGKKELDNGVSLTPAQPVGFGCPCHGGQYDTEGNRTAGPPVRALDRAEYSIVDGNLVLGTTYSVASVEGTGADAQISRYTRMPPGVHVDGWSAWLYPLEVPQ
jgi:Rieske Fe-S protein